MSTVRVRVVLASVQVYLLFDLETNKFYKKEMKTKLSNQFIH
jgi:hypothetical protein